jgi:dihydrofolate reductase
LYINDQLPRSIEGHAILSDEGCIADAAGRMPDMLKNPADWAYFQGHLDRAALVVTGRLGHEAHLNTPGRQRLVFSSRTEGKGFSRTGDVAFVDPARFDVLKAFARLAPAGGTVAVTGGTGVFDWFAARGLYTAFHLVRAHGVRVPGGRPLFTGGKTPEDSLLKMGMVPTERRMLDGAKHVELTVFVRQPRDAEVS